MLKRVLKRSLYRGFFALDRIGLHVLPKHYYSPVADYSWLRKNKGAWMGRASLTGVHWDLDEQLDWLRSICEPYYHEVLGLGSYREIESSGVGPGFGPIEFQVLHCFVRHCDPVTVVEIGSGVSTACMLRAFSMNKREGRRGSRIICVEPFPRRKLREQKDITLVEQMAQTVPSEVFEELETGDLLSIDSTHTVKTGSELLRIFLDIIPSLRAGVFIHIHDIYLPYLYSRTTLSDYIDWQETSFVLALLKGNQHLSVQCCLSALHYDRPKEMKALLADYRPEDNIEGLRAGEAHERHFPSSLWLRTS